MKLRILLGDHLDILTLWSKGREAMARVPGLGGAVWRGFLINLLIYLTLAAGLSFLFYLFVNKPLSLWIGNHTPDWLALVSRLLLWLVQIVTFMVFLVFSIRVSLKFMGLWYEMLVSRVVANFRGDPPSGSLIKGLLRDVALTSKDVAREVVIAIGLLFVGLVPIIGPVIVFVIASHLMGKTIVDPYRSVLRAYGDKPEIRKGPSTLTLTLGWAQMVMLLIPLIGWIFLPISLIHQVLGLAWQAESLRASRKV